MAMLRIRPNKEDPFDLVAGGYVWHESGPNIFPKRCKVVCGDREPDFQGGGHLVLRVCLPHRDPRKPKLKTYFKPNQPV